MTALRRILRALPAPMLIAALAVAVPALAAGALSAHATRSRTPHCFNRAHRSIRCPVRVVRGPRGLRGLRGFTGPRGKTGPSGPRGRTGATGATGAVGPASTARAYAVVVAGSVGPTASSAGLAPGQTSNVSAVRRSGPGTYCLTPGAGIDPAHAVAQVSPELSYTTGGVVPLAVFNAQRPGCLASEMEVQTYDAKALVAGPVENRASFAVVIA